MARREMWMGVRGRERWVPVPATGMDSSPSGWESQTKNLNGGAGVRSSFSSHKEYNVSWTANGRDKLRPIIDMASGMHGTGLIYFVDPMAADKNVLPLQWSFPALAALDGPVLWGTTRPSTVPTPANALDYPATSAQYTPNTTLASIYLPIPPGMVAWVGWHGSSNGTGGVQVTPILPGNLSSTVVLPTVLPVTSTTRVNTSFSSTQYQGIELRPGGGTATSVSISGIMVQILPIGQTPKTGGFISGQGNSGCKFSAKPKLINYGNRMGADGLIGMSANLVEVGDWL